MKGGFGKIAWAALAVLGAFCLGTIALRRGEPINALWIVVAAVSIYLIAYRYYSLFIADKVLGLDANAHDAGRAPQRRPRLRADQQATCCSATTSRPSPAPGRWSVRCWRRRWATCPGMLWILAGVVFAGAVQDFIVLFISTRRDGRSLGDLIKQEMGAVPGMIALFGTFMIMIIILAVLALIVVKALAESPWGTFTVAATIPIAIFMGVYLRFIRPGRIGEISVIGFVLLMLAICRRPGRAQSPTWAPLFTFDRQRS